MNKVEAAHRVASRGSMGIVFLFLRAWRFNHWGLILKSRLLQCQGLLLGWRLKGKLKLLP